MTDGDDTTTDGGRTESVRDGPLSVEKTPDRREDGFVITYALSSSALEPIEVAFDDDFEFATAEKIGFHHDHAPDKWESESTAISVQHTLAPGESSRLMLGIVTGDTSVEESAVMSRPSVTNVETVDVVSSTDAPEGASRADDDPGLFERAKKSLMNGAFEANEVTDGNGVDGGNAGAREDTDDEAANELEEIDLGAAEHNEVEPGATEHNGDVEPENSGHDGDLELEFDESGDPDDDAKRSDDGESPPRENAPEEDRASGSAESVTADENESSEPLELNLEQVDEETAEEETAGEETADESEGKQQRSNAQPTPEESADDSDRPGVSIENESLVAALATELETEDVSDGDLRVLEKHLALERSRSEELRLSHVQSRLDDMAAYVSMLEAFIDERGTLSEFAESTADDMDSITTDLDSVTTELDSLRSELDTIHAELDELDASMDALRADQTTIERDVDAMQERFEEHERSVNERLEGHESTVAKQLDEHESKFTERLDDLDNRQSSVDTTVDRLESEFDSELESVRAQLDRFEQLAGALESVFQTEDHAAEVEL